MGQLWSATSCHSWTKTQTPLDGVRSHGWTTLTSGSGPRRGSRGGSKIWGDRPRPLNGELKGSRTTSTPNFRGPSWCVTSVAVNGRTSFGLHARRLHRIWLPRNSSLLGPLPTNVEDLIDLVLTEVLCGGRGDDEVGEHLHFSEELGVFQGHIEWVLLSHGSPHTVTSCCYVSTGSVFDEHPVVGKLLDAAGNDT